MFLSAPTLSAQPILNVYLLRNWAICYPILCSLIGQILFSVLPPSYVIGQILLDQSRDVIVENPQKYLVETGEKVAAREIPLNLYEIHKVRGPQSLCLSQLCISDLGNSGLSGCD